MYLTIRLRTFETLARYSDIALADISERGMTQAIEPSLDRLRDGWEYSIQGTRVGQQEEVLILDLIEQRLEIAAEGEGTVSHH